MYTIGDYVVKPGSGVCKIDNIMHLNMSGIDKLCSCKAEAVTLIVNKQV